MARVYIFIHQFHREVSFEVIFLCSLYIDNLKITLKQILTKGWTDIALFAHHENNGSKFYYRSKPSQFLSKNDFIKWVTIVHNGLFLFFRDTILPELSPKSLGTSCSSFYSLQWQLNTKLRLSLQHTAGFQVSFPNSKSLSDKHPQFLNLPTAHSSEPKATHTIMGTWYTNEKMSLLLQNKKFKDIRYRPMELALQVHPDSGLLIFLTCYHHTSGWAKSLLTSLGTVHNHLFLITTRSSFSFHPPCLIFLILFPVYLL